MTDCESILEMNKKCWDYLSNIQIKQPDFYFVPRKINKLDRLEQGYFFIGNEYYMQISFWNGGDSFEKIHNISWGVYINGQGFIEISARDNQQRAESLSKIVKLLENKTGKMFIDNGKGKWSYQYPTNAFYLDTLQSFIEKEKIIIDEYLKNNPIDGIDLLDEEFNETYVKKLLNKNISVEPKSGKGNKKKQTGTVSVSPSSYIMALKHNELQNALVDFLRKDKNNLDVTAEKSNIDIVVLTKAREKIYYELKTSDVKDAIRVGLGQLLEYSHYSKRIEADKLIIVTEYAPNGDNITYLKKLRELYSLPIYYQQFDMKKKQLSVLY